MSNIDDDIVIKQATQMDIHEITKMQVNAWQEDFVSEPILPLLKNVFYSELKRRWSKELESDNEILVLAKNNTVLGFLIYAICTNSHEEIPSANFKSIYIIPSMRRNGLGTLLCQSLFARIKYKNIQKISTWVLKENHRAKLFYESLGFHLSSEKRLSILREDETLTEVLYFIDLSENLVPPSMR